MAEDKTNRPAYKVRYVFEAELGSDELLKIGSGGFPPTNTLKFVGQTTISRDFNGAYSEDFLEKLFSDVEELAPLLLTFAYTRIVILRHAYLDLLIRDRTISDKKKQEIRKDQLNRFQLINKSDLRILFPAVNPKGGRPSKKSASSVLVKLELTKIEWQRLGFKHAYQFARLYYGRTTSETSGPEDRKLLKNLQADIDKYRVKFTIPHSRKNKLGPK